MLARVVGQDLEHTDDGVFRIIRGTATDRVISTVDPDARHGHKTSARWYDGYKGHVAVDPDGEIITDTQVTAATPGTPASRPTSSTTSPTAATAAATGATMPAAATVVRAGGVWRRRVGRGRVPRPPG